VTHTTIARHWLGKHIPEVKIATIEGQALLGNGPINMHSRQQNVFSMGSVPRNYKRTQSGELKEYYNGVRREYNGAVQFSWKSE
jgi:hypothetical protein